MESAIMKMDDILDELRQNRGYFPREAVEEAIRRSDEITPHLLRALQEAIGRPVESMDEDESFLPLYAMYLLARFRNRGAYPLIMEMCRLPRERLNVLIGDTVTGGLPRIIASVFDGDTAPIKSVIENSTINEYVRGSAIHSLSVLVHEGVLARADVIDYFSYLFRGGIEKVYSHLWDMLASETADLYAKTLAGDIRKAYEEELLWPGYRDQEDVDKVFAMEEEAVLARSKKECGGLIDDVVKEMQWWSCFKPKPAKPSRTPEAPHHPGTVMRSEPKVGRNAPCPCGSGKKYKKCCGR